MEEAPLIALLLKEPLFFTPLVYYRCFYDSLLELDFKDLTSATGARRELLDKEFDGFKKLFGKFIDESGPSVVWDNIEKLPEDAVIAVNSLKVSLLRIIISDIAVRQPDPARR